MKGSNFKLLSNIFRGAWYMHPDRALAQLPLVDKLISGEVIFEEKDRKPVLQAMPSLNEVALIGAGEQIPQDSVVLVHVAGSLMKEDFCGDPGMDTMGKSISSLDSNPNVKGLVLIIDSPGGTVDGIEEFARRIKATSKPIVAFVDGLAASAAYWAASQTDNIILSGETAEVGSIGTMIGFRDYTKFLEDQGIKDHFIMATKSYEKWASYLEAKDGKYNKMRAEELDPLNEVFLSSVKAGRPNVQDEQLHGTVYFGSNAVRLGLADSVGTLEDAVAKVIELASGTSEMLAPGSGASGASGTSGRLPTASRLAPGSASKDKATEDKDKNEFLNQSENMFNTKLDKAVQKVVAKKKAGEEILAEDIAPVNAELEAQGLEGFAIARVEDVNTLETSVETLTAEKTDLQKKLTASEAEVKRLGELPGASHTEAEKPAGDTAQGGAQKETFRSEADEQLDKILDEQNAE